MTTSTPSQVEEVHYCEYCDWRGPKEVLEEHYKDNHDIKKKL